MSKIIVRKQEYANNGTHADEIKAVVRDDLVVNTLSSATDLVPSVGLLNTVSNNALGYCKVGIYAGQSKTITVPNGSRHLLAITTLNANAVALYSIGSTGGGVCSWIPIFEPSTPIYTFTRDGNKVVIADTGSVSVDMIFINVSGSPITEVA